MWPPRSGWHALAGITRNYEFHRERVRTELAGAPWKHARDTEIVVNTPVRDDDAMLCFDAAFGESKVVVERGQECRECCGSGDRGGDARSIRQPAEPPTSTLNGAIAKCRLGTELSRIYDNR
jgi:hypothetical protein